MKAYNVHARLGRCDGFLMLPTALQSQIVEQVQSILAEQNQEDEGRADSTSANSGEIATPGQTAQGGAPHPIATPAPASEAVASVAEFKGEFAQLRHQIAHWLRQWERSGVSRAASIHKALAQMHTIHFATPTPGDSADAPVQQAGRLGALLQDIDYAVHHGWPTESLERIKRKSAALKGEQPVEPSGGERGEV
jgi:hypothetical protein